jgi:hypothetical protein
MKRRYFIRKGHATRVGDSNSRQKREKTIEHTNKTKIRSLCTVCRACLIPASYFESTDLVWFSSLQFSLFVFILKFTTSVGR